MRAAPLRLEPWASPLLLMALIWLLSDQPDLSSGLGVIDLVGRKLVHLGTYALLCALWWRALCGRLAARPALAAAFLAAAAYGALDEYHQTFVPGRSGSLRDVAIDAAGAALAAALLERRAAPAARASRAR